MKKCPGGAGVLTSTLHSSTHSGWTPGGLHRSPDGLLPVQVESTLNTTTLYNSGHQARVQMDST
jgi:hypothetical protein